MVWIWQHDKHTNDYKIILNCVRSLVKNKSEKIGQERPKLIEDLTCNLPIKPNLIGLDPVLFANTILG
jgi:hypothetical protein